MIYFVLIIVTLLITLRMIVRKPAKAATAKERTSTRKENAIKRSWEFQRW